MLCLDDFVAVLCEEFLDDEKPTPKFTVKTSDGELVWIGRKLWSASPVLEALPPTTGVYEVNSSEATVKILIRIFNRNLEPERVVTKVERFAILSLIYQLQLQCEFPKTGKCGLISLYQLCQGFIPRDCLPDDALNALAAFCELPLREKTVYQKILTELKHYGLECDKLENAGAFMNRALRIVDEKLVPRTSLGLELLPTKVDKLSVLISIVKVNDKKQTAVLHKGTWTPVDLFGRNFNANEFSIKDFYLQYDRYVIFKGDEPSVFYKNLRESGKPSLLLNDCEQLLIREEDVFALSHEKASDSEDEGRIMKWDGSHFKLILRSSSIGRKIDYLGEKKLLGALSPSEESIALYRYCDGALCLVTTITEAAKITNFSFCRKPRLEAFLSSKVPDPNDTDPIVPKLTISKLYIWCGAEFYQVNTSNFLKQKGFLYGDHNSAEYLYEKKEALRDRKPVNEKTLDVRCLGKTLFKYEDNEWHILTETVFRSISLCARLFALSELRLLPGSAE